MEETAVSIILIHLGELHCLSYDEEREPEKKTSFDFGQVVNTCICQYSNTGTSLLRVVNVRISRVSQLSEMSFTGGRCGAAEMYSCAHIDCTFLG